MITCIPCEGKGKCKACKGCGRTGYFLVEPPSTAKPCPWCRGAGLCRHCSGKGEVEDPEYSFTPKIHVVTSLKTPTSITVAAFTGATWRTITIPEKVLQRSFAAQRGWISWRTNRHFKESGGKCLLFGDILGYIWLHSFDGAIRFDIRGNVTENEDMSIGSGSGWLSFKGRKVSLGSLGSSR